MRRLILLVGVLYSSTSLAPSASIREAIEPLLPGLTVRVVREGPRVVAGGDQCAGTSPAIWECVGSPPFPPAWTTYGAFTVGFDAAGNVYHVSGVDMDFGGGRSGLLLRRVTPSGTIEDVARIVRFLPGARFDPTGAIIDVTSGRIWILVNAWDTAPLAPTTVGTVELSGLPTLFDTLLTFVPGQQALRILMPAHPDGFRSADSLQVWTGDVRTMPEWSQAEPLTCEAVANPAPGQLVTVSDTLPDPAVGKGRYYLVASQNGADRRLGRQYFNGTYSARLPATLPACQ